VTSSLTCVNSFLRMVNLMTEAELKQLLLKIKDQECSIDDAMTKLKALSVEDLGFAKLDHHRSVRNGFPEVIFAESKTPEQVCTIFKALLNKNNTVIATRASVEHYNAVKSEINNAMYNEMAKIIYVTDVNLSDLMEKTRYIAVCTAGTSDMPVAEEAALTAELMGNKVDRIYDVGVAGIHRLLNNTDRILGADVIIVIAGMEGALASVVGGLTDKPVIAVPTSVGYGASFGGLSALLTMLNSCASGVGVVNIDNGFGAAYLASSIMKISEE